MAWLAGWSKRVKLTVDKDDITANLDWFPILVHLSTNSGINSKDVSFVFDELLADADRKKIAVTTEDGVTQCYVEIDFWDSANRRAWLWAKAPSLKADVDTNLFLYFDVTHADNTDYVDDPSVGNSVNVWTGFGGVWHFNELNAVDSTGNGNTGSVDTGSPAVVDSIIGKGIQFTPTQRIALGADSSIALHGENQFSIEFLARSADTEKNREMFTQSQGTWSWNIDVGTYAQDLDNNDIKFIHRDVTTDTRQTISFPHPGADVYNHYVAVYDVVGTLKGLYINGVLVASTNVLDTIRAGPTTSTVIGHGGDWGPFSGIIDELRIIKAVLSPVWAKASYETQRDHLITFGNQEMLSQGMTLLGTMTFMT